MFRFMSMVKRQKFLLSVDSDVQIGVKPTSIDIQKCADSEVADGVKKVMIVDDCR